MADTDDFGHAETLRKDLARLQDNAPRTGDICIRLLSSGEEVFSHSVLFGAGELDGVSVVTGETLRGAVVRNVEGGEKEGRVREILAGELAVHRGEGEGGFEIIVQSMDGGELGRVRVHRALVGVRVPYFGALFSGGFGDSAGSEGVVWEDVVGVQAARGVVGFCYGEGVEGTVEEILDLCVAADFLGAAPLVRECVGMLRRRCHAFACRADCCAEALPRVLAGIRARPALAALAAGVYDSAMGVLAGCVRMWKRRLFILPDEVLAELVATTTNGAQTSESVYRLFLSLTKLQARVARSAIWARWEEQLLEPLFGHCAQIAARGLGDGYLCSRVRRLERVVAVERAGVEELLRRVARCVGRGNCEVLFTGLGRMPEGIAAEAGAWVLAWFRREWASLVVEEGVFFAAWEVEERGRLAGLLGVGVEDLVLGGGGREGAGRGGLGTRGKIVRRGVERRKGA